MTCGLRNKRNFCKVDPGMFNINQNKKTRTGYQLFEIIYLFKISKIYGVLYNAART
jgi:hypothetical protein